MDRSTSQLATFRRIIDEEAADMTAVIDADGAFAFVSPSTPRVVGWQPEEMTGRAQASFVHPDDQAQLAADMITARSGRSTTTTLRFRCSDRAFRWMEVKYRAGSGAGDYVVASLRDIADRERVELALRHQLSVDPLTGVGNRSLFTDRLQHALRRLARQPGKLAVLMLDVDRFKVVNDALGHAVGDDVLAQLASRLLTQLRPGDTLARLGGDEFAILAEDLASPEDALQLAERITTAGRTPLTVGSEELLCTLSVGVAVTDRPGHSPENLMQQADMALYRAKDRGRDRAEVFDEELRTRAVSRLSTERMLRRALAENRLRVEYQPIVRYPGESVVGAEALVRIFDGPGRALLQPPSFLVVAEETGLLAEMDEWVMEQALGDLETWETASGTRLDWITLNVTARQLAGGRLLDRVHRGLARPGVDARNVRLESALRRGRLPEPRARPDRGRSDRARPAQRRARGRQKRRSSAHGVDPGLTSPPAGARARPPLATGSSSRPVPCLASLLRRRRDQPAHERAVQVGQRIHQTQPDQLAHRRRLVMTQSQAHAGRPDRACVLVDQRVPGADVTQRRRSHQLPIAAGRSGPPAAGDGADGHVCLPLPSRRSSKPLRRSPVRSRRGERVGPVRRPARRRSTSAHSAQLPTSRSAKSASAQATTGPAPHTA